MSLKFNPFTGTLDFTGSGGAVAKADNFSYYNVPSSKTVTIPLNQQMLFKGILRVEGVLINRGQVIPIKDDHQQMGQWNPIPVGEVVLVPFNRVMFYKFILINRGILRNQGTVEAA